MNTQQQKPKRHYRRTTKETKRLRDYMLSIHPNSPSWREAVISMYKDELDNFVEMAESPYKVVMFERDWEAMRSDLRQLLHKRILLNVGMGY